MRRATTIAAIILTLIAFTACGSSDDLAESPAPAGEGVSEATDVDQDLPGSMQTSTAMAPAVVRANSWQPNVTGLEVPKPQIGKLSPVIEIDCRVLSQAAFANGLVLFDCGTSDSIIAMEIASGQEKWRFTIDDSLNSPFEKDGIVYVMGENNIYALDPASGSELWRAGRNMSPDSRSRFMLRTVAVDSGIAFVLGESDGRLHALDARTGQAKWEYKYGTSGEEAEAAEKTSTDDEDFDFTVPGSSSPVVAGDLVYITATHIDGRNKRSAEQLRAVDINSGQERWVLEREQVIFGTPVIADGVLFAVDEASGLSMSFDTGPETRPGSSMYAFDAATGEEIWNFRVDQESLGKFAAAGGKVFVSALRDVPGEGRFTRKAGRLYALDASSGEVAWSFDTEGAVDTEVFVAGGMVVFGSEENPVGEGAVRHTYARDAATGEHRWMLWNEEPKNTLPPLKLIAEGKAYFLSRTDTTSALFDVQ